MRAHTPAIEAHPIHGDRFAFYRAHVARVQKWERLAEARAAAEALAAAALDPEPKPEPLKMWTTPVLAPMPFKTRLVPRIQLAVCVHFKVSKRDLLSVKRTANFTLPRQVAMYLTKTMTSRSLPEIGRRFGGRDHTTVLHAVRKIEHLRQRDPDLDAAINSIKEALDHVGVD
jgi:DnaA-like protein